MTNPFTRFLAALLAALPAALAAQAAPPAPAPAGPPTAEPPSGDSGDSGDDGEIVVTAQRQVGAVIGDIPPDIQLGPADIRSYGATSIAELLDQLAPQTRSGRGRGGDAPVTLLNGRRISGFSEIRDIPTEAILRVDILPEEVALKYGYKADQRVVNIVLRPRFRAATAELEGRAATGGGALTPAAEASYLRIDKRGRFNVAAEYRHSTGLLESDRDILQTAPRRPFDLTGNVVAPAGAASPEIDPAFSALAGRTVTVAAVPATAATGAPTLAAFLPGANAANATNLGRFRSLLAQTDGASLNAVLNRPVGAVNATLNARFEFSDATSLLGLPTVALTLPAGSPFSPFTRAVEVDRYAADALRQDVRGLTGHLGLTADGMLGSWRWSLTANGDRADTRTLTDRAVDATALQTRLTARDPAANPFAPLGTLLGARLTDRADTASTSGNADLLLTGTLIELPAGAASASVRGGYSALGFDSTSSRAGIVQSGSVTRRDASGRVNIDLPIASRRRDVLGFAGELSLNVNATVDQLSDFGTLRALGGGVTWAPVKPVSLVVSYTDEDGAPTPQQLGNPQIATPQVTIFDFRRGQSVEVTRLDGGNAGLAADNRRVFKAGLTLKPWEKTDLSVTANYVHSTTRNAISAFPSSAASSEIEAAFPDRFVRDASGNLVQIDARPVNFERAEREEIRWGINFSKPLKSAADDRLAAARAARGRPGGPGGPGDARGPGGGATAGAPRGPGGGGRGFGGGGFGGGGSRLQAAVYYTLHLSDEVLIRPGVPVLDLLDGAATGSRGGQPRHEVEIQAGATRNGLGARLSANWQSSTFVTGTANAPGGRLDFGALGTVNLRLFANLGQLPGVGRAHPWLRGTRVLLAVDNLTDARQRVVDATGATPSGLQPDRLDPLGRSVRLSLRKLFF